MVNFLTGFLTGALQSGVKAQEAKKEADLKRATALEERRAALELYGMKYSMEQATKQAQREAQAAPFDGVDDRTAALIRAGHTLGAIGSFNQGALGQMKAQGEIDAIANQNRVLANQGLPTQAQPQIPGYLPQGGTGEQGSPMATPQMQPPQAPAPIQVQDLTGQNPLQNATQGTGINFQENPQWQANDQELAQLDQKYQSGQATPEDMIRYQELIETQAKMAEGMDTGGVPVSQAADPGQGDTTATTQLPTEQPSQPTSLKGQLDDLIKQRDELASQNAELKATGIKSTPWDDKIKGLDDQIKTLTQEQKARRDSDRRQIEKEFEKYQDLQQSEADADTYLTLADRIEGGLAKGSLNIIDKVAETVTGSKGIYNNASSDVEQLDGLRKALAANNLPPGSASNQDVLFTLDTYADANKSDDALKVMARTNRQKIRRQKQRKDFLLQAIDDGMSKAEAEKAWNAFDTDYRLIEPDKVDKVKNFREYVVNRYNVVSKADPSAYLLYRDGDDKITSQDGLRVPQDVINDIRANAKNQAEISEAVADLGEETVLKILGVK